MKAYGKWRFGSTILEFGHLMEVSGQLHTPAALSPGKEAQVPNVHRRQAGPQSQSGRRGEEKILDPSGTATPTPRSSSPQPVAIPTALSRLLELSHTENSVASYVGQYLIKENVFVAMIAGKRTLTTL
jgi:hypothetical protein